MELLHAIVAAPFIEMAAYPDFLLQVVWEGFVAGVLYSLIALGFVLIYKASGVFNFAQGIMVVFAALALVSLHRMGVPAWLSVLLALGLMGLLAIGVERLVLRKLVNQHEAILLMATIGLTLVLKGFGQLIFGGEPKPMITEELGLPVGSSDWEVFGGIVIFQHIDIAATVVAVVMVLAWPCSSPVRASAALFAPLPMIIRQQCRWVSRCTRYGSSSGLQPALWHWTPASCGVHAPKYPLPWRSLP